MHTTQTLRIGMVVVAAVLLLGFVFAGQALAASAKPAATASATTAAPAGAEAEKPAAEGASAGETKEIPHVVGNPSPAQLQDLRNAWAGIPGYDLLLVSILGLIMTMGVVVFAVFKQSRF